MSNSPVTSISARKRGTTRFFTGSTPSTCSASSSSRILRAPRSAVIAVPATPASTIAVTNGANSRIDASTKKPPRRSSAPNSTRKFAAWRPGAAYPKATVETSSGNQHSRRANMNWDTNSPPYGYGGRMADTMVFPVRIIMSPTSSSRPFAGRNALSATPRTNSLPLCVAPFVGAILGRQTTDGVLKGQTRTRPETCAIARARSRSRPRLRWYGRRRNGELARTPRRARRLPPRTRGLRRRAPGRGGPVGRVRRRGHRRVIPGAAADRRADDAQARGRQPRRPRRSEPGGDGRDRAEQRGRGARRLRRGARGRHAGGREPARLDPRRGPGGRRLRLRQHVGRRAAREGAGAHGRVEGHRGRTRQLHRQMAPGAGARGRRRARAPAPGGRTKGQFAVTISDEPVPARV